MQYWITIDGVEFDAIYHYFEVAEEDAKLYKEAYPNSKVVVCSDYGAGGEIRA